MEMPRPSAIGRLRRKGIPKARVCKQFPATLHVKMDAQVERALIGQPVVGRWLVIGMPAGLREAGRRGVGFPVV